MRFNNRKNEIWFIKYKKNIIHYDDYYDGDDSNSIIYSVDGDNDSNRSISVSSSLSSIPSSIIDETIEPIKQQYKQQQQPRQSHSSHQLLYKQPTTTIIPIYDKLLLFKSSLNLLNLFQFNNKKHNNNIYFRLIKSIIHYGDNIGAKTVKCVINESSYETQTLLKHDYDIYQVSYIGFFDGVIHLF